MKETRASASPRPRGASGEGELALRGQAAAERRAAVEEQTWEPSSWREDKMSDGGNKNYINFRIKRYKKSV